LSPARRKRIEGVGAASPQLQSINGGAARLTGVWSAEALNRVLNGSPEKARPPANHRRPAESLALLEAFLCMLYIKPCKLFIKTRLRLRTRSASGSGERSPRRSAESLAFPDRRP